MKLTDIFETSECLVACCLISCFPKEQHLLRCKTSYWVAFSRMLKISQVLLCYTCLLENDKLNQRIKHNLNQDACFINKTTKLKIIRETCSQNCGRKLTTSWQKYLTYSFVKINVLQSEKSDKNWKKHQIIDLLTHGQTQDKTQVESHFRLNFHRYTEPRLRCWEVMYPTRTLMPSYIYDILTGMSRDTC